MTYRISRRHVVFDYARGDLATAHSTKNFIAQFVDISRPVRFGHEQRNDTAARRWTKTDLSNSVSTSLGERGSPIVAIPVQHWGIQSEADVGHPECVQHLQCGGARSGRGLHLAV